MNRNEFLRLLQNEEEDLSNLSEFSKKAVTGARQSSNPKQMSEIMGRLDRKIRDRTESRIKPKVLRLPYLMGIAASVCLLVLAGTWWLGQDARMVNRYFEPIPSNIASVDIQRSVQGDLGELEQALFAYENEKYAQAIPLFQKALESYNRDSAALNLYYGISLIGNGQAKEAIEPLKKVQANREESVDLQRAGSWYLALAFLADGNKKSSVEVLNVLIEEEGDYQQQAQELKERIGAG